MDSTVFIGEEELQAMEARLAHTTHGRWEGYADETFGIYVDSDNKTVPYPMIADLTRELEQRHVQALPYAEYKERYDRVLANAVFIGHAHQDMPRLITALREAYAKIDELERSK